MSAGHILVVEDEPKIAQLLLDYLERDDYSVSVLHEGSDAVDTIRAAEPDFLILDLMLPGKDGLSICREVRQFSNLPIMMLTAKVDEIDRLIGLEIGADDYVCKPFSPREVVSRVRTILRRVQQAPFIRGESKLSYAGVSLDVERFECMAIDTRIDLTPVEFRLLQGLMERPGRVLSRDQLMNLCYADERVVSDRTIDTHVKNLRKKLEPTLHRVLIQSIYGVGYKLD
ncbi:response regulator [Congregibacter variabilis]|uniref:Response regulator n=1 Tax=Congregibacter variabilis TaxID=3081200 RepID=A0ABZ0I021_9GAMM|nr:response regulator [Congregibacter sp. IMCC43200]